MPQQQARIRYTKALRIATQVLAFVFVLGAVGGLVSFKRYVEASPRFCQSCHVVAPEIAMWMESEHRQVRCQSCHHQSLEDGLRILKVYVAGGSTESHAPVDVESCAGCHATHDSEWPSIADSSGHRVHAERGRIACTACHGREMHFDRPARGTCQSCHEAQVVGSAHEAQHCLACHNFLSREDVVLPQRKDCLRCHKTQDRPIVIATGAPMQFSCSACHRPHSSDGVVLCNECHKPRELVGMHGVRGHGECGACHAAHNWLTSREQCYGCHRTMRSHHPDKPCSSCHSFEPGVTSGP